MKEIRYLLEKILELGSDHQFFDFQNSLVQNFYNSLGQGYSRNEGEIKLVERLVEVANDKSYGPIKLSATMLHGKRSHVEFNYLDRSVTKELGDMAVISVVTRGKVRLLQKLCIIQNKKIRGKSCSIDLKQLFLLKNFPPFSGKAGFISGYDNITFRNASGCLGAFGLLDAPGEMLIVAAPKLAGCIQGKKSFSKSDLSILQQHNNVLPYGMSSLSFLLQFDPKGWFFLMEDFIDTLNLSSDWRTGSSLPFLGNIKIMYDLYDFVRTWSQLSLGEITCLNGLVTNKTVDSFANLLLLNAGLGQTIPFPTDDVFLGLKFQGQMAVFTLHLDLAPEVE